MKNISKLLTLPGNGVYTVNTAKDKKDKLLKAYYGTKNFEKAQDKWLQSYEKLSLKKPWILGIPSDNGGGIHRGANWGPLVLRQELIENKNDFFDLGDVRVIPHLLHDKYLNDKTLKICQKALYGRVNNLPVSPLSIAEKALDEIYKKYPKARIFGIGGDHSTSYPLVKCWLNSRENTQEVALIHFDAHTDLLEQRLGIDLCFGTWTHHILKDLASSEHITQIGIRSSAHSREYWKKRFGVEQIWAQEVSKKGIEKTYQKISSQLKKLGVTEIYISFDIDALDKKYASATGTPEENGLLPSDCAAMIKLLAKDFKVTGADLMELAPFVLPEGVQQKDQLSSIQTAGALGRVLLETLKG